MPRFTEDEVRNLRNTHLLRKFSDGDQTIIITTPKSLAEILTDTRFISYLKRFNFKEIIVESNDGIFSFSDTLKSRLGEQEEPSPSFKEPLTWTRAVNPDTKTFKSYISDIMRSRWYSNFGKNHQELETKISEIHGVK
ncbi:MAG: hypothetical protein NZO16_01195 [Deltaproteobacteria bacterium]|nr:hypothetical protein [Deltaproteobacteria bacterium]